MPIRNMLKKILIDEKLTLTELLRRVNDHYGRDELIQNFDRKINKGTMQFDEAEQILDIIGYDIEIKKRPPQ